jgi:hypothetical protein
VARSRLDAVGAFSQIDGVQVVGEDLVLAALTLEAQGEPHFDAFAPQGLGRAAEVAVLDQLLGDRRAALDHGAGALVGDRGAGDGSHVDAVVVVEAAILGAQHRVDEDLRNVVAVDGDAVLHAQRRDGRPVRGVHQGLLGVGYRLGPQWNRLDLHELGAPCRRQGAGEQDG